MRPVDILYHDNFIDGGTIPVVIFGGVNTVVNENIVNSAGFIGIAFADDKAFAFPDDGPIPLGSVKGNIVDAGVFGIIAEGPTTITEGPPEPRAPAGCETAAEAAHDGGQPSTPRISPVA